MIPTNVDSRFGQFSKILHVKESLSEIDKMVVLQNHWHILHWYLNNGTNNFGV